MVDAPREVYDVWEVWVNVWVGLCTQPIDELPDKAGTLYGVS